MSRELSHNEKYALIRRALILAFADDKFCEVNNLTMDDLRTLDKFIVGLYYTFCKVRKDMLYK